jgi:hypothetical protein
MAVVGAVLVTFDAGDVVALLAHLLDEQGRGVEEIEEALDLFLPVGAGAAVRVETNPVVHHHAQVIADALVVGVGRALAQAPRARLQIRQESRSH